MVQKIFIRLGWFVLLLLLQVLLFGHIHLFGYATPMPYVYFLIILSLDTPRWLYLVSAFALGLAIDIFSCTPGMTSASLCAVALIAPWLLEKFRPSDKESEDFSPSARSMKWGGFLRYAACSSCSIAFSISPSRPSPSPPGNSSLSTSAPVSYSRSSWFSPSNSSARAIK